MKLTRSLVLGLAFLLPVVSMAHADDKAAAPAAEGEKPAKKGKKAKAPAAEGEKKVEEKK